MSLIETRRHQMFPVLDAAQIETARRFASGAARDFAPISLIGSQPNILVVNPALGINTIGELIAYAKAHPGKLNYGHSGYGAAAHLSAELFKSEAKVDIVSVSYKGSAPAPNMAGR